MKNIHILPTDNPSRLYTYKSIDLYLHPTIVDAKASKFNCINQNIYITSDEEIKEGDWYFDGTDLVHKKTKHNDALVDGNKNSKKIILTTDQDLIKDGVQSIDDEFLEWFVKNPSYKWVEINFSLASGSFKYKIIIPKEEPEKETLEEKLDKIVSKEPSKFWKESDERLEVNKSAEYFAHNYFNIHDTNNYKALKFGFQEGAKWQTKRMYSEEEVEEIVSKLMHEVHCGDIVRTEYAIDFKLSPRKWFEQFKKK